MKIHIIQPALPFYRIDFFQRISDKKGIFSNLTVYYSKIDLGALTNLSEKYNWSHELGSVRSIFFGLFWQQGVSNIIIKKGDIVVISGAPRYISNIYILLKAKFIGAKTIWWGHYRGAASREWRLWLRTIFMRLSDALIFYTDLEVKDFFSSYKFKKSSMVIGLNNGLDFTKIKLFRKPYIANKRENAILFIGRLTKKSELQLLLDALNEASLGTVKLHVIGSGNQGSYFKSFAQSIGVYERVSWHGEITDEARIARIANRCSLFVYPGAVGLSLLHAMSYGLPSILHSEKREHMPEFSAFEDRATGLAYKKGSNISLANKIAQALENTNALKRWSTNSIKKTSKTFNTEDMARRFCELVNYLKGI